MRQKQQIFITIKYDMFLINILKYFTDRLNNTNIIKVLYIFSVTQFIYINRKLINQVRRDAKLHQRLTNNGTSSNINLKFN